MRKLKIDRPDPHPAAIFSTNRCDWFVILWGRWIDAHLAYSTRRRFKKHGNA